MEAKKGAYQNATNNANTQNNSNEVPINETIATKQHSHQHNTAPQHLRLLQYGMKIPNHQHTTQIDQTHPHQQLNSPLHLHVHQHNPQLQYQTTTHRHLPHPAHSPQYNNATQQTPRSNTKFTPPLQHPPKPNNQIFQDQSIYHQTTVQPPPPLLHPHPQLIQQNTPQIWVPHQPPPIHYHQQQIQNKTEKPNVNIQPIPPPKPKEVVERKKSTGGTTQLRSPAAKRPLEAPVTMQGWLYKQGSEGLMLWKKRWFVLSEYCLFYYKGLEEEKLLGSILLPSYKVSVCGSEDKVNKKYAFKCEHANMRTYILAADSHELMLQWVRVLNLACTLQSSIDTDELSALPEPNNTLKESNTDATDIKMNNKQRNSNNNSHPTPVHMHSSSNTTDLSNQSQQELSQYNQPLYANAPPKPRRLNDGFSSPSPDVLERYANQRYYQSIHNVKSPIVKPPYNYTHSMPHPQQIQSEYIQHQPNRPTKLVSHDYTYNTNREYNVSQNTERRTPDTYGRSKLNPNKTRHQMDYEDVYIDQTMYKRPLSPIAYSHDTKKNNPLINPAYRAYTPVNMLGPKDVGQYGQTAQLRKSPSTIARPHSADFLEYEFNHRQTNPIIVNKQQPRPKSSLDINRNTNDCDNYFYSEERYAEKMRKSAQYLQNMPIRQSNDFLLAQKVPPPHYPQNDHTFPLIRSSTQPLHYNNLQLNNTIHVGHHPVRSRSVLSEGSLSKELDVNVRDSCEQLERESISPGFSSGPNSAYNYVHRSQSTDQFNRSASARLAQNIADERSMDGTMNHRNGDRKREESMKRLLEWKQRMLQSPLNRKMQGNRSYPGRPEYYQQANPQNIYMGPTYPDIDRGRSISNLPQYNSYSSDDEASGSISLNTRDTFPRSTSSKKIWGPNPQTMQARSITNLNKNMENEQIGSHHPGYYVSQSSSQQELNSDNLYNRKESCHDNKMNVSAGELLGRTHEELVLLLIQLRRQSAHTLQAIENYYSEIDTIQAQLHLMDQARRLENLQKLEQIKQHLLELEKQYEKGKPLVNLVDNMVKLGSLYRLPSDKNNISPYIRDRLEFNQQIQERRLLAEERRDWNRLNPNHFQLQEKVQQLYQLDKLIQEESGTLYNLQQDKEDIERALGGLRLRLNKGFNDPAEIEQARKQQILLENELSRVHTMLAKNSKKLEETVAGNARLEQELLVLKQKLQTSRQQRSSPQFSNAGDSLPCAVGTSAMLESDLQKVQKKIGDLQKQRQELSMQVRQLTDRSNNLVQLKSSASNANNNQCNKRKVPSLWRETDLDTMDIIDHGEWDNQMPPSTPLYINTELKQSSDTDYYNRNLKSSDSTTTTDDITQNANALNEKQEIKTVRIVKRESERRQRDREKTSTGGKWDAVAEEDDSSQNSSILFRPTLQKNNNLPLNKQSSVSSPSLPQYVDNSSTDMSSATEKSPNELSPIFKSEAARQIITEMSVQDVSKQQLNRRAVPKEKRRHYTAPHNNMIMKSFHQLPTDDNAFDKMILNTRRARDDLDMERALRQRIDAPDVVRSTLSNKELKYNENTIDNILGTPNKINIPERYIPEQLPQLSAEEQEHRLRKVESIKKMLSDTAILSGSSKNLSDEKKDENDVQSSIANKATTKMIEEKKQREHLLQLNQILAKQVMEMSKIVAVKALAKLPLEPQQMYNDDEDSSPVTPLPLYQQRDNFYS